MHKKEKTIIFAAGLLITIGAISAVSGGALENSRIGIRGFPMGSAYAGIAEDASAVYYNPAGMVFGDFDSMEMQLYAYSAFTGFTYETAAGKDKSNETPVIPGFFFAKKIGRWALGVGGYTPNGGGTIVYEDFQNTGYDFEKKAGFFVLSPAFSYKVSGNLALGLGISVYRGVMTTKTAMQHPLMGTIEVESEYGGIAGYGGSMGILYKSSEQLSLGFSIKSGVAVSMDGTVNTAGIENDSTVEFDLPYYFTLAAGHRPAEKITLGYSISYMLWDTMDEIVTVTGSAVGDQESIRDTGYINSFSAAVGVQYDYSSRVLFTGSLKYEPSATEDEGLSHASNDVDRLSVSAGIGYIIAGQTEFRLNGVYASGFEREYDNSAYDQNHIILLGGLSVKY